MVKSTDGGHTWKTADTGLIYPASPTDTEDLRVDALALDPRSPNVLYAGTGLGVFKTTDGARTWKLASAGIKFGRAGLAHRMYEGFIGDLAIDPVHTSTVYANGRGDIWKTTNGGATWKRVLPDSRGLAIDPRRPETVYAEGASSGYRTPIVKSVDGGSHWRVTGSSGLPDDGVGPLVVDRRTPGIVYVGGTAGLFASRNKGRTWSKLFSPESSLGGV